jgi:hypothetical protein
MRAARRDAWTKAEMFVARLKHLVFELAMLVCFLIMLYKLVGLELGH